MANLVLKVELTIDIPNNSTVTSRVDRVSDSSGEDQTQNFNDYCKQHRLELSTQPQIINALVDYAKTLP